MTKIKNKMIAAIAAAIVSVSMSVAVSAASGSTCPPHITKSVYLGVKYNHSLGEHEYVSNTIVDADGNIIKVYSTCSVRGIGYRYAYKCTICGITTQEYTQNTIVHSKCGA